MSATKIDLMIKYTYTDDRRCYTASPTILSNSSVKKELMPRNFMTSVDRANLVEEEYKSISNL